MKCNNVIKSNECIKCINKVTHVGTQLKFEAISKYVKKWIEIMKNMKYKELTFIDCMASSGLYFSKVDKVIIEGTAIIVIKIFKYYAMKYPGINFNIILNELDPKYIKCLNCVKKECGCGGIKNLNINIVQGDKYDFIDKYYDFQGKQNHKLKHTLFLFDPYGVEFKWESLGKMFNYKSCDVILTHFYPNDAKRNITNPKTPRVKKKEIAQSYKCTIEKLEDIMKTGEVSDKNEFFRSRLNSIIKNESQSKKHISYSPVFNNQQQTHVYDILCISRSHTATAILKNCMFKIYQDIQREEKSCKEEQLNIFNASKNIVVDFDIDKLSEYRLRYDEDALVQRFIEKFNGCKLDKKKLTKELELDPYLPSEGILSIVRKKYGYKIEDRDNIKYYCFPKKENINEQN